MIKTTEGTRVKKIVGRISTWLLPGLGIKRWIVVMLFGITFIAVGAAFYLLDIYRNVPETWYLPFVSTVSLRFLPRIVRTIIFGGIGFGILSWGIWGMNRALMAPYVQPGEPVMDTIATYRRKRRGPKILTIGGGTGLSVMLRGLKAFTYRLTAVVTVADDGGSSGRLRKSLGILPPGDIRSCLAALSNDEALLSQLFQYRFAEGREDSLEGHSFGNLLITAMTEITGSFEEAIAESGRVLSVHGRVMPSTLHDVKLVADIMLPMENHEVRIEGESSIPKTSGSIRRVWLEPNAPTGFPRAIQSILAADLIVIGPGSLYTSLLPNLLVPEISDAIRASRALKIFVCNVATQRGETQGYSCEDHLQSIEDHLGEGIVFDVVLVNNNVEAPLPKGVEWVKMRDGNSVDYPIYLADLVDSERPWRHDADKLSRVLINLLQARTGPLSM